MANYQSVTINEPTAGEVEPEEKPQEETVEQPQNQEQEQPQEEAQPEAEQEQPVERPEWLPEKFDSAEDMAKAYSELEKKMGAGAEENEEQSQEAGANQTKQLLMEASKEYYDNNGDIADSTFESLEQAGISRELVDRFRRGQEALEEKEISTIQGPANGDYDVMAEWAGKNLPDDEFNAFNEVINNASVEQAKLAVAGLYARYKAEVGAAGPKLVTGGTTGSSTMPFQSMQEVSRAMQDPRYKSGDKAYHNEVDRRLAVSNF